MRPWSHPTLEHWSTNSATLSIREPRGKWMSQTLTRSSGYLSAVLPALRKPNYAIFDLSSCCFRQANRKTGASIVTIFSRERPAMVLNDAAGNREPHSGPVGFCGKKWLEKLVADLRRKTRAKIAHADQDISI